MAIYIKLTPFLERYFYKIGYIVKVVSVKYG